MNKGIFFDRDDCLIVDKNYMSDPNQIEFFPDTFDALKQLGENFKLFIVTNQSGIGRGYFTEEQMHIFHTRMLQLLNENGIKIEEIAFCPHTPEDNCDCRKPKTKLVTTLCQKHNINPASSYFIGDKVSDAQCGKSAGMTGCLIHNSLADYPSFNSLSDFVKFVSAKHLST